VKGFKTLTLLDKKAQPERAEKRLRRASGEAVFDGTINRFAFYFN